ncbi:hypothetical protein BHE90_001106 [Fusarium euwallaceae]|uniref:Uncharacterized protein n=2 Tax=Fusarium solani species complex TaxID=232080 RepID=A0A430M8K4_9HYPO|nr:hypothetical protein CEP51_012569 [Fusarium floridanum]RTE84280.1 hypothetical protein BHE90_001106 [Fusarium euwallaceae]
MPRKTLEGLEEAVFRSKRQRPSDTPRNVKPALFANTTWISASTIRACGDTKDEEDDDDGTHGVLVFQRPDNWLQLAEIPRDHLRPASLLCPIVEAMENTPVYSHAKCRGDYRRGLLS